MILHWGNEGEGGSEHSVNGNFFPAEIQVRRQLELELSKEDGFTRFTTLFHFCPQLSAGIKSI